MSKSIIPHGPWFIRPKPTISGLAIIENGTQEGSHIAECEWPIAQFIVSKINDTWPTERTPYPPSQAEIEALSRELTECQLVGWEDKLNDLHDLHARAALLIARLERAYLSALNSSAGLDTKS